MGALRLHNLKGGGGGWGNEHFLDKIFFKSRNFQKSKKNISLSQYFLLQLPLPVIFNGHMYDYYGCLQMH